MAFNRFSALSRMRSGKPSDTSSKKRRKVSSPCLDPAVTRGTRVTAICVTDRYIASAKCGKTTDLNLKNLKYLQRLFKQRDECSSSFFLILQRKKNDDSRDRCISSVARIPDLEGSRTGLPAEFLSSQSYHWRPRIPGRQRYDNTWAAGKLRVSGHQVMVANTSFQPHKPVTTAH